MTQGDQTEVLPELDLHSVFDQVRSERTLLSRVMIAAIVPLVLLTLLLLFALVSTAAQVRRPHVALAKLRGQSRAQVLRFALAEPFLVVLVAVPIGVGRRGRRRRGRRPRLAAPRASRSASTPSPS